MKKLHGKPVLLSGECHLKQLAFHGGRNPYYAIVRIHDGKEWHDLTLPFQPEDFLTWNAFQKSMIKRGHYVRHHSAEEGGVSGREAWSREVQDAFQRSSEEGAE